MFLTAYIQVSSAQLCCRCAHQWTCYMANFTTCARGDIPSPTANLNNTQGHGTSTEPSPATLQVVPVSAVVLMVWVYASCFSLLFLLPLIVWFLWGGLRCFILAGCLSVDHKGLDDDQPARMDTTSSHVVAMVIPSGNGVHILLHGTSNHSRGTNECTWYVGVWLPLPQY